jgi:hypothetical protein
MKIICSWCKRFIGEKEPFEDVSETHAKCSVCLNKQKSETKKRADGNDPVRNYWRALLEKAFENAEFKEQALRLGPIPKRLIPTLARRLSETLKRDANKSALQSQVRLQKSLDLQDARRRK